MLTLLDRLVTKPLPRFGAPLMLLLPNVFTRSFFRLAARRAFGPTFSVSFDVDFRADVEALPELLRVLRPYPFKTSFAIIGRWIEEYPDQHRMIVDEGHEIVNHTYSHPNNDELDPHRFFNLLSPSEQAEQIQRCHEVGAKILGVEFKGFRTPHFGNLYSENVYSTLQQLGYLFSSSQVSVRSPSYGQPYQTGGIWELPVSTCPRHPFAVFDTWHCLRPEGGRHQAPGEFQTLFLSLARAASDYGIHVNLYFDPRDIVRYGVLGPCLDKLSQDRSLTVETYEHLVQRLQVDHCEVTR